MHRHDHIPDEQLSAYFDGELLPEEKALVERHVAACTDCRKRLAALETMRRTVLAVSDTPVSDALWDRIERALPEKEEEHPRKARLTSLYTWRMQQWAVAAVLLIAISAGALLVVTTSETGPEAAYREAAYREAAYREAADTYGFDYGLYLSALREPARMEQFDATYNRQEVSLQEALAAAHVPADEDLLADIPEGVNLKAVYVLTSAATRSMQVTYRHDRAEIAVFRQPKGYPVLFAGYKIEPAAISGKQCLMVDDGTYCAITFATEQAQYVVIGRRDDLIVAQVIDELLAAR